METAKTNIVKPREEATAFSGKKTFNTSELKKRANNETWAKGSGHLERVVNLFHDEKESGPQDESKEYLQMFIFNRQSLQDREVWAR